MIGTFILDAGEYFFSVGNGAHAALNNILTVQGYGSRIDAAGDAACVKTWKLNARDEKTFSVTKAGAEVSNKLEYADFNAYQPGTVTYLSRSDWAATRPKTYTGCPFPKTCWLSWVTTSTPFPPRMMCPPSPSARITDCPLRI